MCPYGNENGLAMKNKSTVMKLRLKFCGGDLILVK
jgi:hypothetical protein